MRDDMSDDMNDRSSLTVLADAFTELERRADVVTAEVAFVPPAAARHRRWPVIAAAAAGVAVVATGAALLAQPSGHSGRTAAGGRSTPVGSVSQSTASVSQRDLVVPSSPAEIARRFRTVLGDTATFTVTDTGHAVTVTLPKPTGSSGDLQVPKAPPTTAPNGAAIVGRLTAGGVTGGYDVQMLKVSDGTKASCDGPTHCSLTKLGNGTLAIGRIRLEGGGVTYTGDFVRTDGAEVLLHVSNRESPKGAGPVLGAKPPLSLAQVRAIVMSKLW